MTVNKVIQAALVLTLVSLYGCDDDNGTSETGTGGTTASATGGAVANGTGGVTTNGTGGVANTTSPCASLCRIVDAMNCAGDAPGACLGECEQLHALAQCGTEIRAVFDCYAGVAQSNWECGVQGKEAQVKAGFCDSEDTALETCFGSP